MSTLETFALPCLLNSEKKLTYVVKKELVDYPVFKHIMRSRDPVVVGRSNPRDDFKTVMQEGTRRLKQGTSIIIFPQTTRSRRFDPEQFNSMGVKLAKRAEVPVVPVALKTDAWSTGRLLKDYGRIRPSRDVYFAFDSPMTVSGNGKKEHERCMEFISDRIDEWNRT
jgi:1-acyl-sn-glycerol-3-phosphate acyltransferase